MNALLSLTDVRAAYVSGVEILQGLSLSVAPGSLTLIIGPNGAGKSTVLKTIFGFLKNNAGAIAYDGTRIDGLEPFAIKARGIAYVPQEINTFPLLSVDENLRMGGWLLRRDGKKLKARIDAAYDIFPALAQKRRQPAGQLSGGQGRMLSIAREIVAQPRLMLVDEPTAGLAPNLVTEVYGLLQQARQALAATILLVDQNVEDALTQADAVYMLNLGRVKAEGPAADFPPQRVRALIHECLTG